MREHPDAGSTTAADDVPERLLRALRNAATAIGFPWERLDPVTRPSGVLLVVDETIAPLALVRSYVAELDAASGPGSIRCRVALHHDPAAEDADRRPGSAVFEADLLVDAPALRRTLDAAGRASTAVIASDSFFGSVLRPAGHEVDLSTFAPVAVAGPEGPRRAWIRVPGYSWPPALAERDQRSARSEPAVERPVAGPVQHGGIAVHGAVHVAGDMVARDKIVGDGARTRHGDRA